MYSIIDIESNGAGFRKECIIEVAIFKYDGHEIVDQFISLVNPEADITHFVQKLTRITPKMVKTAPKFHEIAKRIVEITENTTLVGHNIEFDYRMLRQSFQRLGYEFKINTLDTIPLAKKLIPEAESYSLGKLVKSLGIPLVDMHRAGGDARATLDLFKLLISKDHNSEIIQTQFDETNAKTYINKVKELTQDLPNDRGIIYFQDAQGKILYSDFVEDINKASKKLFNSKSKKYVQIQEQTEQIHFELAGNQILAKLMMRSKNIKKKESFPYSLYYKNSKYIVEKNNLNQNTVPILKLKSFTQGLKVINFIKTQEEFNDPKELEAKISLKNRIEIWSLSGKTLGEKAFILVEKGKITAYGFYEFYNQIQNKSMLEKLKIPIVLPNSDFNNELKLAILKGDIEIHPFPEN